MVGPRVKFHVLGTSIAIGLIDFVLGVFVLVGVLHERGQFGRQHWVIVPVSILIAILCFLVNLLSERLRARLSRAGTPALISLVTLPVAYEPTTVESRSTSCAARGGVTGMAIDLTIGLIAIAVFMLVRGTGGSVTNLLGVAAVAIGGSAGIRFLSAPSLNGGRVLRWMFEWTLDDEESAIRAVRVIGYGAATIMFLTGLLLLTVTGESGFWGIGLAAAGIDIGVLSTVATRQTFWLQTASNRTLADLLEPLHATVSMASPLEEMLSVLSVDGPSALAVVRDPVGNPTGIMQFSQMRSAVTDRSHQSTIGDVMIPIDRLPLIPGTTCLLDAARLLLECDAPAVRYQNVHGKIVIATIRDLGLPF